MSLLPKPARKTLLKHNSWAPGYEREQAWLRQKERRRRSKSLTDEDFDELKACIELGFGFDSPDLEANKKLSDTFPALGFYYAVNKSYNDTVSKSRSASSLPALSVSPESSSSSPATGSPLSTLFSPGDDPKTIKTRLKHWAQVVGCSVRQTR